MPTPEALRKLLRSLACNVQRTSKGLELADEAYSVALSLYTEEEKTHCLMMASRQGLECASFADLHSRQGSQMLEFWLDSRKA